MDQTKPGNAPEHVQAICSPPTGHVNAPFGDEIHPLVFQTTDLERAYFFTQPQPAEREDAAS